MLGPILGTGRHRSEGSELAEKIHKHSNAPSAVTLLAANSVPLHALRSRKESISRHATVAAGYLAIMGGGLSCTVHVRRTRTPPPLPPPHPYSSPPSCRHRKPRQSSCSNVEQVRSCLLSQYAMISFWFNKSRFAWCRTDTDKSIDPTEFADDFLSSHSLDGSSVQRQRCLAYSTWEWGKKPRNLSSYRGELLSLAHPILRVASLK